MEGSILKIKDLYIRFKVYSGYLEVVDGVNLVIGRREKVSLVGETGCGKTVTMKAVIGALPITSAEIPKGEIFFAGKDLLKIPREEKGYLTGRIALIPQDPAASLSPVFTVATQLIDTIKYSLSKRLTRKEMKEKAIKILKEVALPDPERNLNNYPFQLSGGMKQRVLIAMALVAEPDLLLADEPTTALDVTVQDQILRLMREMVEKRDVSMLLVTHNLGTVRELTDKVYVMYAGQIAEVGDTEAIFFNPLHPYTKALIRSVPKLTGEGISPGIPGMIPDYMDPPCGCRFRPRCDHAMEVCAQKPSLQSITGGHEVACFFATRE